jgi:hypothetical protein
MPMGPAHGRQRPPQLCNWQFAELLRKKEGFLEKLVIFHENAVFHGKKRCFFGISHNKAKKGVFLAKNEKKHVFLRFPKSALFCYFSKHFENTFFSKPAIY